MESGSEAFPEGYRVPSYAGCDPKLSEFQMCEYLKDGILSPSVKRAIENGLYQMRFVISVIEKLRYQEMLEPE